MKSKIENFINIKISTEDVAYFKYQIKRLCGI